jgi:RND family efflux transporter MFP subunit
MYWVATPENRDNWKPTMRSTLAAALAITALQLAYSTPANSQTLTELQPVEVSDWKAVYGRVEARDRIPARTRLGGTLVELSVADGDLVEAGQALARVVDEKLDFQISALDAQLQGLESQLENAEADLTRGEELLQRGVTTAQRLDALRTQVSVLSNQIASAKAERRVLEQRIAEGTVLAPLSGRVLDVPVAAGAVVAFGETVATIGGGGFFLRLAVPERHARDLQEGDAIRIETEGATEGRLARVYPQIENGRVIADVEVVGLDSAFVDARVLVRLPIGKREALLVPEDAIVTQNGLDFIAVSEDDETAMRTVVLGQHHEVDGHAMVEVVTGIDAGMKVVTGHE